MAKERKKNSRVKYYCVQVRELDLGKRVIVQQMISADKRFQKNGPVHVWWGTGHEPLMPKGAFEKAIRELESGAYYTNIMGEDRKFDPKQDEVLPFIIVEN